jgi:hypothetical protein
VRLAQSLGELRGELHFVHHDLLDRRQSGCATGFQ